MNKSLETVLKALEQDALAFCSESDWAIVVAECEKAGNVRRVSKSAQVILQKAMSRSEAGRFAAQQRWKNHVAADRGPKTFAERRSEAEQRLSSVGSRQTMDEAEFDRDLKMMGDDHLQGIWSGSNPNNYSDDAMVKVGEELVRRGLLFEDPEGPSGPYTLPEIDRSPSVPDPELEALVERIRAGKIARGENPNENSNDAYNELGGSDPNLPENQVGNYSDESLLSGLHDKNETVEYKQKMASELLRRGYGVDDIFGVSDDASGDGKKVKSRFASPEIKVRAEKIMRQALAEGLLNNDEIDSILTGVANNDSKRLARRWLQRYGFTDQQITEFVGNTDLSGGKAPKQEYIFGVSDDGSGGRLPNPPGSSERKMVPDARGASVETSTFPNGIARGERGSGSFDDGTPFLGKFLSPTNNDGEGEGLFGYSRVNHPVYKTPKYKAEVKAAALYQLHNEIVKMHRQAGKQIPNSAKLYMDALNSLSSVKEMYGMDSGKSIVAYTISNIKFFGEQGKALKAELQARLK